MSFDLRPRLNAKIKYTKKAFIVKNCDTFVWTEVQIWLNYNDYAYKHTRNIEPNETVVMPFSDFAVTNNCLNTHHDIGARFDGKKTKKHGNIKHYFININANQGHNFYELYGCLLVSAFIKLYEKVYRIIYRRLHRGEPPKL